MQQQPFPNESEEYRRERNRLLEAEASCGGDRTVAAQRRALPPGGVVPEDYRFEEAADGGEVRFCELFEPGKDTLVIYSFMFPRYSGDTRPGPAEGETARLPLVGDPVRVLHLDPGLARRRRASSRPADQPRRRREVGSRPDPQLRPRARLAPPAAPLLAQQHLQPRLPRRDAGRRADADPERVRPRRRAVPPHMGLGAHVSRPARRVGGPPRRLDLADLERAGHDARRPRRAIELPVVALRISRRADRDTHSNCEANPLKEFWTAAGGSSARLDAGRCSCRRRSPRPRS